MRISKHTGTITYAAALTDCIGVATAEVERGNQETAILLVTDHLRCAHSPAGQGCAAAAAAIIQLCGDRDSATPSVPHRTRRDTAI